MSKLIIRAEASGDFRRSEEIIREAFWDKYQPGCSEHYITNRLRADSSFVPELSYVALIDGKHAGCAYYSAATIINKDEKSHKILMLGPIAVLPDCQNQGIGSKLIKYTAGIAAKLGYSAIALFGDPGYYQRFGFEPCEKFGISDPSGNYHAAFQIMELYSGALKGISGSLCDNPVFHDNPNELDVFDKNFPFKEKHVYASQLFLGNGTIKPTTPDDFEHIYTIINDAATAYRGVIPADRWHEPYMSREELRQQLDEGVIFHGYYVNNFLLGVMGVQNKNDEVELIRHAYVRTACRKIGIGGKLLRHIYENCSLPMLIGTWADASWAIKFYEKHGFDIITDVDQKNALLRKFWNIPIRQVELSVVLADAQARMNINKYI
ncbi:MAG: GNAT family N-acetyltransferase [Victivallales bacterium]|nr:GNAT family N-acetyltransferase [Victivallales bacterium]